MMVLGNEHLMGPDAQVQQKFSANTCSSLACPLTHDAGQETTEIKTFAACGRLIANIAVACQ